MGTGQRTCQLLQLESGRDEISEGHERRSEVTELYDSKVIVMVAWLYGCTMVI